MAERLQLRRVRGYQKPDGGIVVGRGGPFGNPFVGGDAVIQHAGWLIGDPGFRDAYTVGRYTYDRRIVLSRLHELRGHVLLCWCALDALCHGNTLLRLADRPRSAPRPTFPTTLIVTEQRHCNGCGAVLGNAWPHEIDAAIVGRQLPDVRGECPACGPAYAVEVAKQVKAERKHGLVLVEARSEVSDA